MDGRQRIRTRLAALGFVSLLGQVVLLRELLVASFGSELVAILGLGVWMLGTAAGAFLGGRKEALDRLLGSGLVLLGGLLVIGMGAARLHRLWLPGTPGAFLAPGAQALLLAATLLPASMLSGWLFQAAVRCGRAEGLGLAEGYGTECLGGLGGGLLATFLPALGIGNAGLGLLALSGGLLGAYPPRKRWAGWGSLLLVLGSTWIGAGPLDRLLGRGAEPGSRASVETPYGRTTLRERDGQRSVFVNGALAFESEGTTAEEFVHPAAVRVETPRRVLVLGGLAEGLVQEVLKHGPDRVLGIEMDARALALALEGAPEGTREALAHPAVQVCTGDPRRQVEDSQETFDLILSALPEPDSGQSNRFYTQEFFLACRGRLSPGGVLALRLRMAENHWTPLQLQRGASVWKALAGLFPQVRILPGSETVMVASAPNANPDPTLDELLGRWRGRGIEARLVGPPYLRYRFGNDRGPRLEAAFMQAQVQPNQDRRPVCHPLTLALWVARFDPDMAPAVAGMGPRLSSGAPRGILLAVAVVAGGFGIARRHRRLRTALLAALGGFLGMGLEAVVLLGFQARHGALYQDLGLVLAAFMGGLAAGSRAAERVFAVREASSGRRTSFPGIVLALALGFLALVVAGLLTHPAWISLGLASGLLLLGGGLSGALLAWAAREVAPGCDAGLWYGADVLGGFLAAMLVGIGFAPILGLPGTALLFGVVALGGLLLV